MPVSGRLRTRFAQMQMGLKAVPGGAQPDLGSAQPDLLGVHSRSARQQHRNSAADFLQRSMIADLGQANANAAFADIFHPTGETAALAFNLDRHVRGEPGFRATLARIVCDTIKEALNRLIQVRRDGGEAVGDRLDAAGFIIRLRYRTCERLKGIGRFAGAA